MSGFKFGIEHEVALLRPDGQFADYTNTTYEELILIIDQLPFFKDDKDQLRIDRFKIMTKRWYAEGYERFNKDGSLKHYLVKGIEIRTPPKESILQTLKELGKCYLMLKNATQNKGFIPVWISYHPYLTEFKPDPPLNQYEIKKMQISPEDRTYDLVMLSFGPDLNISITGLSDDELIDIGEKLTFYSPFILPFTYSSPFYQGELWDGLSVRTFVRTGGGRQAARVFLQDKTKLIPDSPLAREVRMPVETGRIEFKSPDSCKDWEVYAGMFALLKGLILDKKLTGRSLDPDRQLHKLSAKEGFGNSSIYQQACDIISCAEKALIGDSDIGYMGVLKEMLDSKTSPAQQLIDTFSQTGSIDKTIREFDYEGLIL